MKEIKLLIELKYDDKTMHDKDKQSRDWFYNEILKDKKGLILHSNELGDEVGIVKVLEINPIKI